MDMIDNYNKKKIRFINISNTLSLIQMNCYYSEKIKCESNCNVLYLKFLKLGIGLFSLFDIFNYTTCDTSSLFLYIKNIIDVTTKEDNTIEMVLMLKNSTLNSINSIINRILSFCDDNIIGFNQFQRTLQETKSQCEFDLKLIKDNLKILELKKKRENNCCQSLFKFIFLFLYSNRNTLNGIKKEEKKNIVENIILISGNIDEINKDIIFIIKFLELAKSTWMKIDQDFKKIKITISKELILSETNQILLNIIKWKQNFQCIFIKVKKIQIQFNSMMLSKKANIVE
ncbi:hypothetical protein ACTFIU_010284 [Dictyostelium citrinum]